jgi:hypothetical protein
VLCAARLCWSDRHANHRIATSAKTTCVKVVGHIRPTATAPWVGPPSPNRPHYGGPRATDIGPPLLRMRATRVPACSRVLRPRRAVLCSTWAGICESSSSTRDTCIGSLVRTAPVVGALSRFTVRKLVAAHSPGPQNLVSFQITSSLIETVSTGSGSEIHDGSQWKARKKRLADKTAAL